MTKYGEQEKRKISSAVSKDREGFPSNREDWEASMLASNRPSTSRPCRPRSGQRSPGGAAKKRREQSSSTSAPQPPPPQQQPVSQQVPASTRSAPSTSKGKSGPNSHVKNVQRRPDLPSAPGEHQAPTRDRSSSRGSRGGGPSRPRGRGRGAVNQPYQRQERDNFSSEDRALFEALVKQFQESKNKKCTLSLSALLMSEAILCSFIPLLAKH